MSAPQRILDGDEFTGLACEILARGSPVRFRAHGRSMAPFIADGDVLTVRPAAIRQMRLGDVAFHRSAHGRAVAHRVIARRVEAGEPILVTRGDAASGVPEAVRAQDVLGRVVRADRGGRVLHLSSAPWRAAGILWAHSRKARGLLSRAAASLDRRTRRRTPSAVPAPRPTRDSATPRSSDAAPSPAESALIAIAGSFARGETWAPAAGFSASDWEELAGRARLHSMLAITWRTIAAADCGGPPESVREAMRRRYVVESARNVRSVHQLAEIGVAASARGIQVILLKGADAFLRIYDEPGCREVADLDLLVRPERAVEFYRILQDLGYEPHVSNGPPEFALLNMQLGRQAHFHRPGACRVDMQVRLLRGLGDEEAACADMWADAQPIIAAPGFLTLSPRHFLLSTIGHYAKNLESGFARLPWLVDVLLGVRKWGDTLDWAEFWDTARRWGMETEAAAIAATLDRCWHVRVPMCPEGATPLAVRHMLACAPGAGARRPTRGPAGYLGSLLAVRGIPTGSLRIRYLLSLVVPTPEDLRARNALPPGAPLAGAYVRHVAVRAWRFLRQLVIDLPRRNGPASRQDAKAQREV